MGRNVANVIQFKMIHFGKNNCENVYTMKLGKNEVHTLEKKFWKVTWAYLSPKTLS